MLRLPQLAILQLGRMHIKAGPLMAHPKRSRSWSRARAGMVPASAVDPCSRPRTSSWRCSRLCRATWRRAGRRHGHHDPRRRGLQRHPRPGEDRTQLSPIAILTLTEPPNCSLDAGDAQGTIRDLSPTVCATIYERMRQIVSRVRHLRRNRHRRVRLDVPGDRGHAEQTEVVSAGRRLLPRTPSGAGRR